MALSDDLRVGMAQAALKLESELVAARNELTTQKREYEKLIATLVKNAGDERQAFEENRAALVEKHREELRQAAPRPSHGFGY